MPDILTHLVCAHETLSQLSEDVREILDANRNIYNLGAQGPDLFFYYKPQPWLDSKEMSSYGHTIHTHNINSFFISGANRIRQSIMADPIGFFKSDKKNTALHMEFAYLAGFLSHYALDTIGHPFIFYFSGVNSGYNHKYFECIVDTLISDIYNGKSIKVHKTAKAVSLTKHESHVISMFLSKTIRDTFNINIEPKDLSRCISDMEKTLRALYDPMKIKKSPLRLLDGVSKAKGKIVTARFPAKYDVTVDHLNIKKQQWFHPCDKNIVYHESFLELLKKSISYSHELIKALSHYLIHTEAKDNFEALIGNKKYDTGLTDDCEMIHEHIIVDFKSAFKIGPVKH